MQAVRFRSSCIVVPSRAAESGEIVGNSFRPINVAELSVVALAHRHQFWETSGWNQDVYDAITYSWRMHIGSLHPDDAPVS